MPRKISPSDVLALSPAQTAAALGIRPERVADAIRSGELVVRTIGPKRRIAVHGAGGIQAWFESWPVATERKTNALR
jgi:hypothetical protein